MTDREAASNRNQIVKELDLPASRIGSDRPRSGRPAQRVSASDVVPPIDGVGSPIPSTEVAISRRKPATPGRIGLSLASVGVWPLTSLASVGAPAPALGSVGASDSGSLGSVGATAEVLASVGA